MFTAVRNMSSVDDESPTAVFNTSSNTSLSNTSKPFDASCYGMFDEDAAVMTSLIAYLAASLIFVAVGLIGNSLSIAVFTSREMRVISSNVYLLVLALSDSLYLVTVFMSRLLPIVRCWHFPFTPADVGNRSQFMCIALQYLSDLFSDYSTCLILAFTVERGMAVFCPIVFKERCTVFRARVVCVAMLAVIGGAICPHHVIMMQLYVEYNVCAIVREYNELFAILYAVEMVSLRVIPVVAIAFLNAFIIVRVTKMTRDKNRRRRRALGSEHGKGFGDVTSGRDTCGTDHVRLVTINDDVNHSNCRRHRCESVSDQHQHQIQIQRKGSIDDRNLQLTIILILVSSSYILAYIPVLMHFVMVKMKMSEWINISEQTLSIFGNYGKALYIGGFAINFFLYTMSGRVFRDQLRTILCSAHRHGGGRGRGYVSACAGGRCETTMETVNTVADVKSTV